MAYSARQTAILAIMCMLLISVGGMAGADEHQVFDLEGVPVTIVRYLHASPERQAEAEALFNTTLEYFRPADAAAEVTARILAGDSTHDIIRGGNGLGYYNLMLDGLFYPVGTIIPPEHYEGLMIADRVRATSFQMDGVYYGFGTFEADVHGAGHHFTAYNRDMFEREGQPDPYKLYLDGNWNYDAVTEIARALTMDTIGDGEVDQWGIDEGSIRGRASLFLSSNDAAIIRQDENGRWIYGLVDPNAQAFLSQMVQWIQDGLTYGAREEFIAGQVGMQLVTRIGEMRHHAARMEEAWSLVPIPRGPHATDHKYPMEDLRTNFLAVNAAKPEALIALANYLHRPDDFPGWRYDNHREMMPDRQAYEVSMAAHHVDEYPHHDVASRIRGGPWDIAGQVISQILDGEIGVSAGVEMVHPEVQGWLDDVWRR